MSCEGRLHTEVGCSLVGEGLPSVHEALGLAPALGGGLASGSREYTELWVQSPDLYALGVVAHASFPSTQELQTGGSGVQLS